MWFMDIPLGLLLRSSGSSAGTPPPGLSPLVLLLFYSRFLSFFLNIYLFGCVRSSLHHVGSLAVA